MKGSASGYGVSGSGEYQRSDYQEQRKTTAMNFGMVLVVLALIVAFVWVVISKITNFVPDPVTSIRQAYQAAEENVIDTAQYPIPTTEARNRDGNYYPVTTAEGLRQRLNQTGVFRPLIVLGNTITPQATTAGVNAAVTVNRLGLNNAYVDLDPLSKLGVSVGEGIGSLFGVDLIQMGYDMRNQPGQPTNTNTKISTEWDNYIGV